ncbi:MAG: hypothetical protein JNL79_24565 [Myxococcales bacterium]|nr:hypothetical protein [Myxococcales bacterium]
MDPSRRTALLAITTTGLAVPGTVLAQGSKNPPAPIVPAAFGGKHQPKPLPFKPGSLKGLSEQLLVSHHDSNYAGAIKNLNRVESELSHCDKDTPPFVVAGLEQSALGYRNSVTMHELYFGNLGGDGKRTAKIDKALAEAYEGAGRWEELFRATAMGIAGGSGWVVLAFDLRREVLRSYWSGGHPMHQALAAPILVLDMYEHAFALDFGAAAAKYVDAFFANVRWDEAEKRLEAAKKAAIALR